MGVPTVLSRDVYSQLAPSGSALFCGRDVDEIFAAIKCYQANAVLRKEVTETAKRYIETTYSKDKCGAAYAKVLLEW